MQESPQTWAGGTLRYLPVVSSITGATGVFLFGHIRLCILLGSPTDAQSQRVSLRCLGPLPLSFDTINRNRSHRNFVYFHNKIDKKNTHFNMPDTRSTINSPYTLESRMRTSKWMRGVDVISWPSRIRPSEYLSSYPTQTRPWLELVLLSTCPPLGAPLMQSLVLP